jgi:hypothetical protein
MEMMQRVWLGRMGSEGWLKYHDGSSRQWKVFME